MRLARAFKHFMLPDWWVMRRTFPRASQAAIEDAVRRSERAHTGELRVVLEATLPVALLLRGATPRERAHDLFAHLGVWDTAHNSGVLIYLQLVDRAIEIVADRGISARIPQAAWDAICERMQNAFKAGRFEAGAVDAVAEITDLLAQHFPPGADNPDELPNRPVVL